MGITSALQTAQFMYAHPLTEDDHIEDFGLDLCRLTRNMKEATLRNSRRATCQMWFTNHAEQRRDHHTHSLTELSSRS